MTFRRRLLLASLATLAAGLGILVVAGNLLLERRVAAETSGLLRARAEAQIAALTISPRGVRVREPVNDEVLDKQAWVLEGTSFVERPAAASPGLDALARSLAGIGRGVERDGPGDIRLLAKPVLDDAGRRVAVVVVAQSTAAVEALRKEVLIGSAVISLLVLAAGALAVRRAVGGALRPVADMTAAARDWGAHDLERRFGLGPVRDELTALAATLDGLLARIAASRRHERRFAAEIAHELRTPLSGMRGRAELALRDGSTRPAQAAALEAVVEQADRLAGTIDALMVAARQELAEESSATVDLGPLLRGLDGVEVQAPAVLPRAEGDEAVVTRALAPLVENARRHARGRVWLEVAVEEQLVRIAVRDDGPGLDPALSDRAFDPGVQGPGAEEGAGLGLPLARRLARSCGGDVTAAPGPGGCFVLALPRADA